MIRRALLPRNIFLPRLSEIGKPQLISSIKQLHSINPQTSVLQCQPTYHRSAPLYKQANTKTFLSTTISSTSNSPSSKMPPRILIFGTGAIGSVYAWILSRQIPTSNLFCVCRSNYEAAKSKGFTINSTYWGNNLNVKPTVVRSIDEASTISRDPFDYIIVTTKALNTTPSTADLISPAVSPNTTIVLIQNGIGIEQPYADKHPSNPLLSTVVYLPATQTSPGVVAHKEIELLHIGTYPTAAPAEHKAAAQAFGELLTSCSATVKVHEDVQTERWSKLLVNASWNPICALTRSKDAEYLRTSPIPEEETAAYVRDVMIELSRVAQACGYEKIDEELVDFQIGRARKRDLPGVEPSMLADVKGGRRLEVDAIVGNALRIARQNGVQTPLLRSLYMLLSGLDGSFARVAEPTKS